MSKAKKTILMMLTLAMLAFLPACHPRMVRHLARAAVVGAAVTGAAVIAVAHAHHHHARCGHHRHWHHGRWVYEYEGHHEYYDPHDDRWYRYR